jgi:hypothetical protein
MKLRLYHRGKPEARHQLVDPTDKAAIGIRNKVGHAVATFDGITTGSRKHAV